jgi:hypothetical protein
MPLVAEGCGIALEIACKSALVRESLEIALRRRPRRGAASCYDMAHDLAGTVKGLPRDLASNPKYMEGFGE